MMQYGQNFALLEGEQVTVLQPDKPALSFGFDVGTFGLSPLPQTDPVQARRALALSLWGKLAYNRQYYRLPEAGSETAGTGGSVAVSR